MNNSPSNHRLLSLDLNESERNEQLLHAQICGRQGLPFTEIADLSSLRQSTIERTLQRHYRWQDLSNEQARLHEQIDALSDQIEPLLERLPRPVQQAMRRHARDRTPRIMFWSLCVCIWAMGIVVLEPFITWFPAFIASTALVIAYLIAPRQGYRNRTRIRLLITLGVMVGALWLGFTDEEANVILLGVYAVLWIVLTLIALLEEPAQPAVEAESQDAEPRYTISDWWRLQAERFWLTRLSNQRNRLRLRLQEINRQLQDWDHQTDALWDNWEQELRRHHQTGLLWHNRLNHQHPNERSENVALQNERDQRIDEQRVGEQDDEPGTHGYGQHFSSSPIRGNDAGSFTPTFVSESVNPVNPIIHSQANDNVALNDNDQTDAQNPDAANDDPDVQAVNDLLNEIIEENHPHGCPGVELDEFNRLVSGDPEGIRLYRESLLNRYYHDRNANN